MRLVLPHSGSTIVAWRMALAARGWCVLAVVGLLAVLSAGPAIALEAIAVGPDQDRIDITAHTERFTSRGDRLQIETAPGADGLSGRVEIKAQTPGTNPGWMVFALHNTTEKSVERWLVAERFTFIGSGISFPDLDASRISAVTPSQGFVPDRVTSDRADIFQISIEPGQTVTLAAEMATDRFPQVNLWKPFVYEAKQRERTLLNGILLGITGLLAVFLTALFAANHRAMFPAAGLVAWSILALLCVDFDFWHRIFRVTAEDNALYRAAAEAAVAASLVIFLFTFLKIARWHSWIKFFWLAWILCQLALVALAPLDPGLAATLARGSFLVIAGLGFLFILYLMLARQDRALALMTSWPLFMVWVFAAALAANGRITGEFIAAGLVSGLVFILLMLGFTVSQFAFRSMEATQTGTSDASQTRNFAIEGAGLATFEWNSRRNEVQTGALIEDVLGLQRGRLTCGLDDWLRHVGPRDQERLRDQFKDIAAKGGGMLQTDFMMRGSDNAQHWFSLRGATLPQTDPRTVRCVGLLRETTREKHAQDRIMQDAIKDHKTGLPNRELFADRLAVAVKAARASAAGGKLGLILFELTGIGLMLEEFDESTIENGVRAMLRLLQGKLGPLDTVGRLGGDRYGILIPDTGDPAHLAKLIEDLRHAIRKPVPMGRTDQTFNANLGVALLLEEQTDAPQLLHDAETALDRAKRAGIDRYEVFRPNMRLETDQRTADAAALRSAMDRKQLTLLYQPVYGLNPERLAGFEAVPRWLHPERGPLGLSAFMPIAGEAGFAGPLALQLMEIAAKSAMAWQKALPRDREPLFVGIHVGAGLPLRVEAVAEVRKLLTRVPLPKGLLRLYFSDDAVRDNPELACDVLERLRTINAGTALSDFGAGQFPIAHLPRLALDAVKLDRWMCIDALAGDSGAQLLRGVASLVRELGLAVQTDTLESPGDVAVLNGAGCTLGSGPLHGEPLDDAQVDNLLAAVRAAERKNERRGTLTGGLLTKSARPAQPPEARPAAVEPATEMRRKTANGSAATAGGANSPTIRRPVVAEPPPPPPKRPAPESARFDAAMSANALASAYDAAGQVEDYATGKLAGTNSAAAAMAAAAAGFAAPPRAEPAPPNPPQVLARSDTPTLMAEQARNEWPPAAPVAAPMPVEPAVGLARLQRGHFGFKTNGASPPAWTRPDPPPPPATAAPPPVVDAPAEHFAPPPLQRPGTAIAKSPPPGSPGSAFADGMPDADILRGLAARLEAALKRDGH